MGEDRLRILTGEERQKERKTEEGENRNLAKG